MDGAIAGLVLLAVLVIFAIIGIYFLLGCVLESISMILLTVPVFFPVSGFTAFGRSRMSFVAFSVASSIAVRKAIVSRPIGWWT